jgi:ubiquinone/menaquinone biosynthesis C-methylase UbiE
LSEKETQLEEIDRIREVYRLREQEFPKAYYSLFKPGNLLVNQELERKMLKALRKSGIVHLGNYMILDVGCGKGDKLRDFLRYGAITENLLGIDISKYRVKQARSLNPGIAICCGNAEEIPVKDNSFDMVTHFTLFTSILDNDMRRNIAKEMMRVVKPTGLILWYDFRFANPRIKEVRRVGKREIKDLFPGCSFRFHRVTLALPIARRLAKISYLACTLLERVPFLKTHYLVAISEKRSS